MQPLVHPRDAARLSGQPEMVGRDGLHVGRVEMEVAAKVQPLFRIGEFPEDVMSAIQSLLQVDLALQDGGECRVRNQWG